MKAMKEWIALFSIVLIGVMVPSAVGRRWGFLLASAKGWNNYAMSADVCHAYQIMVEGQGIPEEQIVVMMYDDIASYDKSPIKGKIVHSYDLIDNYHGVPLDYTGKDVNKKTFNAALQGDSETLRKLTAGRGSGKTIDSGPHDSIFLFISYGGAQGFVTFPDGDHMSAKELNSTIHNMHRHYRFANMMIFLDGSYSGSMFAGVLHKNLDTWAAASVPPDEAAYSTNCLWVYFVEWNLCMAGSFSSAWTYTMQRAERIHWVAEELVAVANMSWGCHMRTYGDWYAQDYDINHFFGESSGQPYMDSASKRSLQRTKRSADGKEAVRLKRSTGRGEDHIPRHLTLYYMLKRQTEVLTAGSKELHQAVSDFGRMKDRMSQADDLMEDIFTRVHGRSAKGKPVPMVDSKFDSIDWRCYEPVTDALRAECPGMTGKEDVRDYAWSRLGVLVNLCNTAPTGKVLLAVREAARVSPLCKE